MFNRQLFAASLEARIEQQKLGLRSSAKQCGVSASTLSRLLHGELPDMESFEKLVAWLQCDPGTFFTLPEHMAAKQHDPATMPHIVTLLRMDLTLPPEAREKLVDLMKAAYQCLAKEPQ